MPKALKKLQQLVNGDVKNAHEYFATNKVILFFQANSEYDGAELLTAFHQLQSNLVKEPAGLEAYQAAINFYYDHRKLLESINIKSDPNFAKFKLIIFYTTRTSKCDFAF